MDLSGNNKNKITGKKYQPVMSVTGLNNQGLYQTIKIDYTPKLLQMLWFSDLILHFWKMAEFFYISYECQKCTEIFDISFAH